jgi:methionyl-tRNA formyltransferase
MKEGFHKMILFTYSFPHKKSQDMIFLLNYFGYKIDAVLAAKPQKLNLPAKKFKYKVRHDYLFDLKDLCQRQDIDYFEVEHHNSKECEEILDKYRPSIGIVAGARILKKNIINKFSQGIINFHPGIIPETRGLDSALWAVYYGLPLGVTAHFIDERVDAGRIIQKKEISIAKNDSFFDINEKLYDLQLKMLPDVIELAISRDFLSFPLVENNNLGYRKSFPSDLEDELHIKLPLLNSNLNER